MNQTQMTHNQSNGVRLTARPTTSISNRQGYTGMHKMRDNVIQEETWNLDKMLSRYNFVSTIPVSSSSPPHTLLAKYRVPQDLITNDLVNAPFKNFIFWNGKVRVEFQITGSPMTQGNIAAVFIPLTDPAVVAANQLKNFSSLSINQTCYLFPNANTVAEMEIPFNSPQAYLNIADSTESIDNTLGYLYIIVFNQVALSTTTTDSTSISIFSHFEDNVFKVPRKTQPPPPPVFHDDFIVITPQSGVEGIVGRMAHLLLPDNPLADAIDVAAGFFGLDNPIDPTITESQKPLITQRMNYSQGPELIDRLSLVPSKTSAVTSDTFATLADEMTLDYLKTKYSYLGTFSMTTSNIPGDVLASFPLNPCPNRLQLPADGTVDIPSQQVSLLQYISTPFKFWQGGLTYKVQAVSTSMQTAKIFFSFNYDDFEPAANGNLLSTSSQYGTAIELNQGSNTFEFTTPYVATTPMLHVPNTNLISSINTMGMMNVSVVNPLIAPNNTPTQVSFNIFIAGAEDFELNTLTASNNLMPFNFPPSTFEIRAQSAAQPLITPMSNVDQSSDSLVAPPTTSQERKDVAQVNPPSFRDILKKYHMYQRIVYTSPTSIQNGLVFSLGLSSLFGIPNDDYGANPPPVSDVNPIQMLWHLIQPMYRQFKGSLNFKIMLDSTPNTPYQAFSIFYQPPSPVLGTSTGDFTDNMRNQLYFTPNGVPVTYNQRLNVATYPMSTRIPLTYVNSINKTAEFSIPYSSRFLSVLARSSIAEANLSTNELGDLGQIFVYVDYANNAATNFLDNLFKFNIFFSFGDEARLGTLYNIPLLGPNSYANFVPGPNPTYTSIFPDSYDVIAPVVNTLRIT